MDQWTKGNLKSGELLKKTRLERGISIESVHNATKIPMDALRAIEEGYTVRTLTPFYIKGFFKIYAQHLGLTVSDVVENYRVEKLPSYVKKDIEEFDLGRWIDTIFSRRVKQRIIVFLGYFLILFVLFKIITFFIHKDSSKESNTKKVVLSQDVKRIRVDTKAIDSKILKKKENILKNKKNFQKNIKDNTKTKTSERNRKVDYVAPAVLPMSRNVSTTIPVKNSHNNVTLTVRAKKNSWLRVISDDEVVFQSTLRLGSVETWIAKEEIQISGKNINFLEFELNGKMIGVLGREDRKVKKLIVTKDGLKVVQ